MSEASRNTPGPWSVQISKGRKVLCVQSATTWICGELHNGSNAIDEGEAVANANLIAASPDLLAAPKAVLEANSPAPGHNPNSRLAIKTRNEAWSTLRAVIAKAEGGPA